MRPRRQAANASSTLARSMPCSAMKASDGMGKTAGQSGTCRSSRRTFTGPRSAGVKPWRESFPQMILMVACQRRDRFRAFAFASGPLAGIRPTSHHPRSCMNHTGASRHEIAATYLSAASRSRTYSSLLWLEFHVTSPHGWMWSTRARC
eukprot:COSAG02_NODE_1913_length_10405_cov_3.734330_4_plen_149_part_00